MKEQCQPFVLFLDLCPRTCLLISEKERGREGKRSINVRNFEVASCVPPIRDQTSSRAHALKSNRTRSLLVYGSVLKPTELWARPACSFPQPFRGTNPLECVSIIFLPLGIELAREWLWKKFSNGTTLDRGACNLIEQLPQVAHSRGEVIFHGQLMGVRKGSFVPRSLRATRRYWGDLLLLKDHFRSQSRWSSGEIVSELQPTPCCQHQQHCQ